MPIVYRSVAIPTGWCVCSDSQGMRHTVDENIYLQLPWTENPHIGCSNEVFGQTINKIITIRGEHFKKVSNVGESW